MKTTFLLFTTLLIHFSAIAQTFTQQSIDNSLNGATSPFTIDLDGDNDIDIVAASQGDKDLVWYRNNGSQSFTKLTIDNNFDGILDVFVADFDNDGDIDIAAVATVSDDVAWWENDGSQSFTKHIIDANFDAARSVYAIDMDKDGYIDILATARLGDDVVWYKNNGNKTFTKNNIDINFNGATDAFGIDMDNDGDIDVLAAGFAADDVVWWENDGSQSFTKHDIITDINGPESVFATDIDNDGDIDVLAAASIADDVVWWENDGSQSFTKHTLIGNFDGAKYVRAKDMNFDGFIDIIAIGQDENTIDWWENDGTENFTRNDIAINFTNANNLTITDLDEDGDMDVISTAYNGNKLAWWSSDISQVYAAFPIVFTTSTSNPMNGFNTGHNGYSSPSFVDIDNDGDLDCFSGSKEFGIYFYENTGTKTNPVMVQRTGVNNPLSIYANTYTKAFITPTFVDIDADGDYDCFVGMNNQGAVYYENQGTKFSPNFVEKVGVDNPLSGMAKQQYNRPTFVDIDNDGDFDAFNAQQNGYIRFYENTGTPTSPTFVTQTGTANPFDGVDLGSFSSISFHDIDFDGDYDALAGENDGRFEYYKNTGNRYSPIFTLQIETDNPLNGYDVGTISITTFIDMDYDGKIDCFLGARNGGFTFLKNNSVLPVELTYFKGEATENGNLLTWQTTSEENNDGFYIERSEDAQTWETLDFVQGNGTTLEVSDYDYLDKNPFENITYYRLKQVDFDGQFEYSNIVSVISEVRFPISELRLYPNPVQNKLTIENTTGTAQLFNALGQQLRTFTITNNMQQIDVSNLPKGQYLISIQSDNGEYIVKRFMK